VELQSLARMIKAGKVIQLPFNYEETVNHYRLRIKTDMKIDGRIYIPKSLEIRPDKLVLTKKQD
jgi:hypothetical protein